VVSKTILIADDEPNIRQLVAFTLRRRGYTILEAGDGTSALTLIREQIPDLVILDVMMPGLTGIAVVQRLAAEPATAAIPVILLSAKGQGVEIEEGLASGARLYLVKPFSPRELAERVAEVLAL
jgi:two-component system phosphate regulon response regulator PhoB